MNQEIKIIIIVELKGNRKILTIGSPIRFYNNTLKIFDLLIVNDYNQKRIITLKSKNNEFIPIDLIRSKIYISHQGAQEKSNQIHISENTKSLN